MSRPSAQSLAIAVFNLPARPSGWKELSQREQEIWSLIVGSLPIDWFSPGDLPILLAYCRCVTQYEEISRETITAPFTVLGSTGQPTINPIFKLQDLVARQMELHAKALRLTQSARYSDAVAATKHGGGAQLPRPWEKSA